MRISKFQIKSNWVRVLIISATCALLLFGFLIIREIDAYEENARFYEEQFIKERKKELEREVQNRVDEIEYELSVIQENANNITRDKIQHIDELLEGVFLELPENVSDEDRMDAAIDMVVEHSNHDPDYLYFIVGMDGTLYLSGTNREMEGINLYDIQDLTGKYYVRDMIEVAKRTGDGYVSYYWPKVSGGEPLLKTSYCRYVEVIDAIVGTGVYHEDLENQVQNEIYDRFQAYYEGDSEYIFVISYDGIVRVHGDKKAVGTDFRGFEDSDGTVIYDEFMNIATNEGAGFLTYNYFKPGTDEQFKKLTYVQALDEWEAYIGLGYYLDEFYVEKDAFKDRALKELKSELASFSMLILILAGMIIYFIAKTIDMNNKYFRQEEMLYEKFSNLTGEGILIVDEKGMIHFANPVAREMLEIEKCDFEKYEKDRFIVEEKGATQIKGLNGKVTYVEIHSDDIFFREKDHTVLFLTDITERFKHLESLKKISTTDQLTGLPNRRKFVDDFNANMQIMGITGKTFCIGIIDLDRFKSVNDTFGHDIGDKVLITFANLFNSLTRNDDILYRYGGEEFVVILPATELEDAKHLLERINVSLQTYEWTQRDLTVSYTAGLVELDNQNIRELDYYLKKMDELLYKGKENGRQQVVI